MIIVNVNKTSPGHIVRESASAAWKIAGWRLRKYGDYLLAVRHNRVVGVFQIDGYERTGTDTVFELTEITEAAGFRVGDRAPDPWLSGQRWPVKFLDTESVTVVKVPEALSVQDVLVPGLTITLEGSGVVRVEWDESRLSGEVKVGKDRGVVELWPYVA